MSPSTAAYSSTAASPYSSTAPVTAHATASAAAPTTSPSVASARSLTAAAGGVTPSRERSRSHSRSRATAPAAVPAVTFTAPCAVPAVTFTAPSAVPADMPDDGFADMESVDAMGMGTRRMSAHSSEDGNARRVKQSGVQNIIWKELDRCWEVQFLHPETREIKTKQFAVRRYMKELGVGTFEEADAAALEAAIVHRGQLVKEGILDPAPMYSSRVKGVCWSELKHCWQAWIKDSDAVGFWKDFPPDGETPEDIERARLQAEEERTLWEREAGLEYAQAEAKTEKPQRKSGVTGVCWDQWAECWHVDVYYKPRKGRKEEKPQRIQRRFRPEGASAEAIERARREAVRAHAELSEHGVTDRGNATQRSAVQRAKCKARVAHNR